MGLGHDRNVLSGTSAAALLDAPLAAPPESTSSIGVLSGGVLLGPTYDYTERKCYQGD